MSEKWLNESPNAGKWLLEVEAVVVKMFAEGSVTEAYSNPRQPPVTRKNEYSPTSWPKPPSGCFAASVWMEEPDSYSKNAGFQVSLLLEYFMSISRETRKNLLQTKEFSQIIVAAPSVEPA